MSDGHCSPPRLCRDLSIEQYREAYTVDLGFLSRIVACLAHRHLVGHVRPHQVCVLGMMQLAGEASDLGCTLAQRRVQTRYRTFFKRVAVSGR